MNDQAPGVLCDAVSGPCRCGVPLRSPHWHSCFCGATWSGSGPDWEPGFLPAGEHRDLLLGRSRSDLPGGEDLVVLLEWTYAQLDTMAGNPMGSGSIPIFTDFYEPPDEGLVSAWGQSSATWRPAILPIRTFTIDVPLPADPLLQGMFPPPNLGRPPIDLEHAIWVWQRGEVGIAITRAPGQWLPRWHMWTWGVGVGNHKNPLVALAWLIWINLGRGHR